MPSTTWLDIFVEHPVLAPLALTLMFFALPVLAIAALIIQSDKRVDARAAAASAPATITHVTQAEEPPRERALALRFLNYAADAERSGAVDLAREFRRLARAQLEPTPPAAALPARVSVRVIDPTGDEVEIPVWPGNVDHAMPQDPRLTA